MDIIAAIDAVTGCQQCGRTLEGSVSDDFCSQDCQQEWHAAHTTPLVGYREPDDLPQHIYNQVEDDDPEVTPHGGSLFPRWVTDEIGRLFDRTVMHTTPPPALAGQPRRDAELDPDGYIIDCDTVRRLGAQCSQIVMSPAADREWLDQQQQAFQAIVAHWTERHRMLVETMRPAFENLSRFAAESMKQIGDSLHNAGVIEHPLPTEPRARALELRRRRNTGPTQQQRAPRAINPRRAR